MLTFREVSTVKKSESHFTNKTAGVLINHTEINDAEEKIQHGRNRQRKMSIA